MAAENGWSTDDLTINTQLGKCVFHCDYVDWDAVDPQVEIDIEIDEESNDEYEPNDFDVGIGINEEAAAGGVIICSMSNYKVMLKP